MSYQKIPLKAGVPYLAEMAGVLFLLDSPGVAGGVDIALVKSGTPGPLMPNRRTAFRHVAPFDGIMLTAAVDTEVGFFASFDDVQLGVSDGSAVKVPDGLVVTNSAQQPIPVNFAGTVAPVLGEVKLTNTDAFAVPVVQKAGASFDVVVKNANGTAIPVAQKTGTSFDVSPYLATAVTDAAPVAVTAARAVLVALSATRRGLRVRNLGPNAVAIGGAAVTFANAVIVIQPGEVWNENEAPGAAWWCIADTGNASSVNLQTIA